MKFTVIILRPLFFINHVQGFDSAQDLQYAAVGIEAKTELAAGLLGRQEVFNTDANTIDEHLKSKFDMSYYTILGTFNELNSYRPWFNGDIP